MKYKNKSDHIQESITLMLEDMCTDVVDILQDKDYMRLYYPLDDTIRNRGKLTLVSPPYVTYFQTD